MEFILSWNNNEGTLVFPVVPSDGIALAGESDNSTFNTTNGELQLIGRRKLRSFELSSFFPNREASYCNPNATYKADGMAYINAIEAVRARRIPFRACQLDNDGKTIFNMPVSITSLEYGLDAAGDIAYKMNFTEYRFAELNVTALGEQTQPESVEITTEAAAAAQTGNSSDTGGTAGESFTRLYTEAEAVWAAKSLYCEWGGEYFGAKYKLIKNGVIVQSGGTHVNVKTMFAAHLWCQCNHVDGGYGSTLSAVQVPGHFAYRANAPTTTAYGTDLLALARDVFDRWSRERAGQTNVGRVLPKEYRWYASTGTGGTVDKFRNNYSSPFQYWDFTLPSPYAD